MTNELVAETWRRAVGRKNKKGGLYAMDWFSSKLYASDSVGPSETTETGEQLQQLTSEVATLKQQMNEHSEMVAK